MSSLYTYTEARKKLASILEQAIVEGEVRVKRKDGQIFVIIPEKSSGSPLDVKGIDLNLTKKEIVDFIHEGRKHRR